MAELAYGSDAKWIWPEESATGLNQYIEFVQTIDLKESPSSAEMMISVDSNYALWVNNKFINSGQYHDYPTRKVYDILPLQDALLKGENKIKVCVHYQGEDSQQYVTGTPGLIFAVKADEQEFVSGQNTSYRLSPHYLQGDYPRITGQLSFSFEYDARDNNKSPWTKAKPEDLTTQTNRPLSEVRPIPKIEIKNRIASKLLTQGYFRRNANSENDSVAKLMQTDFLSTIEADNFFVNPKNNFVATAPPTLGSDDITIKKITPEQGDGVYILIDLNREEAGYFELEVSANKNATIDIAYGQHLEDLRVRAYVGGRNFAARYICKEGRQIFTHWFKRFGCRYLQLHISNITEDIKLHYAGLRPSVYPIEQKGKFDSPDSLQNKIYDVSMRTLHLCMHEHYEDTPWREQALYANDSRNQALCGYYCFGEYKFPAACFDLLSQSMSDDGYLELCAPSKCIITIPSFSLAWILEVGDYFEFTNDIKYLEKITPAITTMLEKMIATMIGDLLPSPTGARYWHFYDWTDGQDGMVENAFGNLQTQRFDALLNMFFTQALSSSVKMLKACNKHKQAEKYEQLVTKIKPAIHKTFWNEKLNAYVNYVAETQDTTLLSELVQSVAIETKIATPPIEADLRRRLTTPNNGLVEPTLSQSFFKFQAIMEDKENYANWVFDKIEKDWGYMLFNGATSFWETLNGASDFANAGSLCHGWSAIPIYFYQAYLLGIKPTKPGFETFTIDITKTIIDRASGIVPTPHGPIKLSWRKTGDSGEKIIYRLSHPKSTKCEIKNLRDADQLIIE